VSSWSSASDAGSTCGTIIKGSKLEPRTEKVQLDDGDLIELGPVKLTYYGPRAFYDYLKSIKV